jgi:ankyrin repeat protein
MEESSRKMMKYGDLVTENELNVLDSMMHSGKWNLVEEKIAKYPREAFTEQFKFNLESSSIFVRAIHHSAPVDTLRYLIELGSSVQGRIPNDGYIESSPIDACIYYSNNDTLRFLLEKGVSPVKGGRSTPPLLVACTYGRLDMIRTLLDAGANIQETSSLSDETALHRVCRNGHSDCIQLLLERGACVNTPDRYGRNAIYDLANTGNISGLAPLIAAGARIEDRDSRGWTPFMVAAYYGNLEMVKELIEKYKANVNATTKDGHSAFDSTCKMENRDMNIYLVQNGARRKKLPFYCREGIPRVYTMGLYLIDLSEIGYILVILLSPNTITTRHLGSTLRRLNSDIICRLKRFLLPNGCDES